MHRHSLIIRCLEQVAAEAIIELSFEFFLWNSFQELKCNHFKTFQDTHIVNTIDEGIVATVAHRQPVASKPNN